MKLKTLVPTLLIYSVCFFCCHSNHQGDPVVTDSKDKPVVVNPVNNVPEFRQGARKEAVAEYKEKTGNPLNDWYFSVKLYETQKTFYYLMKLQFEEIK
ncbi:MAG: hypothetical protein JST13_11290, partial [Bacteroidetes bacterium]|nr:hypothetical protein [Bacteroidota bacterium]